jgi:hypothetical protein
VRAVALLDGHKRAFQAPAFGVRHKVTCRFRYSKTGDARHRSTGGPVVRAA